MGLENYGIRQCADAEEESGRPSAIRRERIGQAREESPHDYAAAVLFSAVRFSDRRTNGSFVRDKFGCYIAW
jgi:hypothetical protein